MKEVITVVTLIVTLCAVVFYASGRSLRYRCPDCDSASCETANVMLRICTYCQKSFTIDGSDRYTEEDFRRMSHE